MQYIPTTAKSRDCTHQLDVASRAIQWAVLKKSSLPGNGRVQEKSRSRLYSPDEMPRPHAGHGA